MEDKVFNLLEKMYADLTEKIDSGNRNLNEKIDEVKNDVKKIYFKIEHEIEPKLNMCLEEISGIKEKLTEHDLRFDAIEAKLEIHDNEINVLKRVK